MESGEVCSMAMELDDVAVLMEQIITRIEVCAKNISVIGSTAKDLKPLCSLISHMFELREKVFLLADTDTKSRMRALEPRSMGKSIETKGKIGSSGEFESEEARTARWIVNKGESREKSQIESAVGESKGSSVEFESELIFGAETESENGGKFKKLLLSICKSVAKLTMVPRDSFELGSIFSLFDEMWGNTCQLVSTEAKFLATCMLMDKHLAHHISTLQLCSEDINWLCTWVPQFGERLQRIEKCEEIMNKREHGAQIEESVFANYISSWERYRRRYKHCRFEDCSHSPLFCDVTRTMQIFSIKVSELEDFKWPLEVYGVVAARDVVDYRRNLLFLRTRDDCQSLTEQDSFLHLTGPSRAIMSADTVQIEIQLKVKGTTKSEDRALITKAFSCNGGDGDNFFTRSIRGCFCRIDLRCEHLRESIQATILSVRVLEGSLPSENGVQVVCSSLPQEDAQAVYSSLPQEYVQAVYSSPPEEDAEGKAERKHVVLLDRKDGSVPMDEEGCLVLSRQVVPVKWKGKLEIQIKTFPQSGDISGCVVLTPELSNISRKRCFIGECELEITVAWSLLVDDEQHILMMSYTKPSIAHSPLPFMKELLEDGNLPKMG
ncbi:unnamed protein product [Alopecurus aequalis]